jgi:hypothetical protein
MSGFRDEFFARHAMALMRVRTLAHELTIALSRSRILAGQLAQIEGYAEHTDVEHTDVERGAGEYNDVHNAGVQNMAGNPDAARTGLDGTGLDGTDFADLARHLDDMAAGAVNLAAGVSRRAPTFTMDGADVLAEMIDRVRILAIELSRSRGEGRADRGPGAVLEALLAHLGAALTAAHTIAFEIRCALTEEFRIDLGELAMGKLVRDPYVWPSRPASTVVDGVVRLLPAGSRSDYARRWHGELNVLARQQSPRRRQFAHALRLAVRIRQVRREIRAYDARRIRAV